MTDVAVERKTYQPADRPWLLFTASGPEQPVPTASAVIDFSLFTAATHFPDGFIPSGVLLAFTEDGTVGPYAGSGAVAGLLYNSTTVPLDRERKVAVAVVDCFAVVSESRLPEGSGFAEAARAALPLVHFRA